MYIVKSTYTKSAILHLFFHQCRIKVYWHANRIVFYFAILLFKQNIYLNIEYIFKQNLSEAGIDAVVAQASAWNAMVVGSIPTRGNEISFINILFLWFDHSKCNASKIGWIVEDGVLTLGSLCYMRNTEWSWKKFNQVKM